MANNTGDAIPIPVGVGWSLSNVQPNAQTPTQGLSAGYAVATFQPYDVNNPGVVTLYNSAGTVILTLTSGGYGNFVVPPGGASYYFIATNGAAVLAATNPNYRNRTV